MQFIRKFRPVTLLLLLVVMLAAMPAGPVAAQTVTGSATIDTGALKVHTGPSPGYPAIHNVLQNEQVLMLGRSSDTSYIFVRTSDQFEGWISSFYVVPSINMTTLDVLAQAEPWGLILSPVNLRTGPSLTYTPIVAMPMNDGLGLLGRTADSAWLYVRHPNGPGWVSSAYVTAGIAFRELPIVSTLGATTTTVASTVGTSQGLPAVSTDFQAVYQRPWNTSGNVTFLDEGEEGIFVLGVADNGDYYYALFKEDGLGWVNVHATALLAEGPLSVVNHETALVGEDFPPEVLASLGVATTTTATTPPVTTTIPVVTTTTAPVVTTQVLGSGVPAVSWEWQPARNFPTPEAGVITWIDEGEGNLQVIGRNEDSSFLYILFRGHSLAWFHSWMIGMEAPVTPPVVDPNVAITGENLPPEVITSLVTTTGGTSPTTIITWAGALPQVMPTQVHGAGVVTAGRLNVRAKPNLGAGIISQLDEGAMVTLLARDSRAGFLFVGLPFGGFGWAGSAHIQTGVNIFELPISSYTVPTDLIGSAEVATGTLNVRTGPNTAYTAIGSVVERQVVNLLARNSDSSWVVIRTLDNTLQGWVASGELISGIPYRQLPITTAPAIDAVGTATVVAPALNLRAGPTTDSTSLGVVYQGAQLVILGRTADGVWLKLRTTLGTVGWLSNGNVIPDVPLSKIPIVQ